MNNVFVVGTPLQLLSAYILANEFFPEATNQLLLINSQGEKMWKSSPSLKKMSSDGAVWRQILTLKYWLRRDPVWNYRKQMQDIQAKLFTFGTVEQVFLGSDKIIQNQILVELLGCTHYARLEDGLWSYHNRDRRQLSKVWQYIRIKFFHLIGNITSQMQYNLGGVGHGTAADADYLFKPELLARISPHAVKIDQVAVQRVMEKLTQAITVIPAMAANNCLLFLGSTFVESNTISQAQEQQILHDVYTIACDANLSMVYKPHPREDAGKLAGYSGAFPKIMIVQVNDPIEVVYAKHKNLKYALSICSSGLLYADVFSKNITPIGLFKLYPVGSTEDILERMMRKAGVVIPDSLDELSRLIK